ncbi:BTB and MATH domain-containing protein 36-like isoform X2 [Haliotis rubra]|uniref:BTB and MATH domain-containing protein 36-like isoform X2 n=1 Tax=Haliotis rubra TaxID=36100 RepID=UPI001EE50534|nr:BTB and MATH domain-containing protein 36-like isoform X2 [Haliotis rubra]
MPYYYMAADRSVQREIWSSVFDEPSIKTNVALVMEGRRLHVNRSVLATASDVFDKMFYGKFKETQKREVPLPGKRYADIVDMLLCIYPSELRPVTEATVDKMLELADEYQMDGLKRSSSVFDEPSGKSDVALVVEGRRLHVNRGCLLQRQMFLTRCLMGILKKTGT